ncbi:MAG: hypothetical protein A2931_04405 [Candidatus Niyogibacteria bacterium RIFCSPLOWO2_01_FULL_45_48]|uniref:Uncharacterized protein n=2 Tax=Candidatus Niyogiibacteriota TaxID=1817912 RepID=A0A1G2EWP0_9BACT|nr:MAG: hypothetical protein A2931_04405 [Candidatus Niyogibacteria bacterium RIFCSPLOWO2_01_FULL_45_48]OGZ30226.1 MAG: hypothetical protein A3J00_01010 [Candidatus Niyogibacteria bacterium RIFCSPLOWO2_02_FULL_45_13]
MKVVFEFPDHADYPVHGLSKEEWEERVLEAFKKVRCGLGSAKNYISYFSLKLIFGHESFYLSFSVKWNRPWETTGKEVEILNSVSLESSEMAAREMLNNILCKIREDAAKVGDMVAELQKAIGAEKQ